jgi:hypothetical protein
MVSALSECLAKNLMNLSKGLNPSGEGCVGLRRHSIGDPLVGGRRESEDEKGRQE